MGTGITVSVNSDEEDIVENPSLINSWQKLSAITKNPVHAPPTDKLSPPSTQTLVPEPFHVYDSMGEKYRDSSHLTSFFSKVDLLGLTTIE